jgi:hypothetical protein
MPWRIVGTTAFYGLSGRRSLFRTQPSRIAVCFTHTKAFGLVVTGLTALGVAVFAYQSARVFIFYQPLILEALVRTAGNRDE